MNKTDQKLKQFFDIVVGRQSPSGSPQDLPDNPHGALAHPYVALASHQTLSGNWIPAGRLTIEEAFQTYRNGYVARLTESLGETYETIWKFLGDQGFFNLSKNYISQFPSTDPNLGSYGRQFPQFISRQAQYSDYEYLRDLAFLDWTRTWLFHQKTDVGLSESELSTRLYQNSKIQFVNSLVWIRSRHPLFSLWKAIHQELDPPSFIRNENVILYKNDDQVYLMPATDGQIEALENLRSGKSLLEAVEPAEEEDILHLIEFIKKNYLVSALSVA